MADPSRRSAPPLRRVLVSTDFTVGASLAVRRAAQLRLSADATITLIHVLPPGMPANVRADATKEAERQLVEAAAKITEISRARRQSVTVAREIATGKPFIEIIRAARSVDAELIVLGRHGRRPIRDLLIGSTTEKVVRKGDLPVLVVSREPAAPYQRPLFTTDLEPATAAALEFALRVVGPQSARIPVLHAFVPPFEGSVVARYSSAEEAKFRRSLQRRAQKDVAASLSSVGGPTTQWKAIVHYGDPRAVILTHGERMRPDIIVVGTHARSGLARMLLGSVAERVLAAAECDVLLVRLTKQK